MRNRRIDTIDSQAGLVHIQFIGRAVFYIFDRGSDPLVNHETTGQIWIHRMQSIT